MMRQREKQNSEMATSAIKNHNTIPKNKFEKKTIKLSINSNVNRKYFVFPNPQQPVLHMAAARDLLKVLISQCVPSLLVAGHFQNDQQPSAVEGEVANT